MNDKAQRIKNTLSLYQEKVFVLEALLAKCKEEMNSLREMLENDVGNAQCATMPIRRDKDLANKHRIQRRLAKASQRRLSCS